MLQVNIHEAKTHLSALIEKAVGGEPFIIAKAGKPLVIVNSISRNEKKRQRVGFLKGQFMVPDDFDRMGETEIVNMFEGME